MRGSRARERQQRAWKRIEDFVRERRETRGAIDAVQRGAERPCRWISHSPALLGGPSAPFAPTVRPVRETSLQGAAFYRVFPGTNRLASRRTPIRNHIVTESIQSPPASGTGRPARVRRTAAWMRRMHRPFAPWKPQANAKSDATGNGSPDDAAASSVTVNLKLHTF